MDGGIVTSTLLRAPINSELDDNICSSMSCAEMIALLTRHGCQDLTSLLDTKSCSRYPVINGGFGEIYRGELDQRKVAIKTIRVFETLEAGRYHKLAARKIYAWSKCKHPNIVELVGLATFRDGLAMISTWVENGSLRIYLKRNPAADRYLLSILISRGLAYLHSNFIIHGDLKGDNVLISQDGVPMLSDFGNASIQNATLQFSQATTGVKYTTRWAAPEVLKGDTLLTREADIYALGMTILEAFTGEIPHSNIKQDIAVMLRVVHDRKIPTRPTNIPPKDDFVGDTIWDLLKSCWSYQPMDRPTAADVEMIMDWIHLSLSDTASRKRSYSTAFEPSILGNLPPVQLGVPPWLGRSKCTDPNADSNDSGSVQLKPILTPSARPVRSGDPSNYAACADDPFGRGFCVFLADGSVCRDPDCERCAKSKSDGSRPEPAPASSEDKGKGKGKANPTDIDVGLPGYVPPPQLLHIYSPAVAEGSSRPSLVMSPGSSEKCAGPEPPSLDGTNLSEDDIMRDYPGDRRDSEFGSTLPELDGLHVVDCGFCRREAGSRICREARAESEFTNELLAMAGSHEPSSSTISNPSVLDNLPPVQTGVLSKKKTPNVQAKPTKPPPVITLKGHSQEVFVVAWNPKIPHLLATGGKDSTLRLWNVPEDTSATEPLLPTRICVHLPAGPSCNIITMAWNVDGTLLATGTYDGIVRVWTSRGEHSCVMTQHQGPIFSVKWSKTGYLLTASFDKTAIVWDVDAGGKAEQRYCHHNDGCLDVEWLDGDFFASCGSDRNIFVESIGEVTPIARLKGHRDKINQLKYEAKCKLLASGSDDFTACIWKVDDVAQPSRPLTRSRTKSRPDIRKYTHKLRGHEGKIVNIQWQPEGDRETYEPVLITSSFDGTVRVWNGYTGDCISILQAGRGEVCGHSLAPRSDILAIVTGNKLILAKDDKEFFSWSDKDSLFDTAWRVDGKAAAVGMKNGMVAVVRMPCITIPGEEDNTDTA